MYTVYSKDNCPWCVKAIELLTEHNLEHTVVKVESIEELTTKLQNYTTLNEINTVPQIVEDKFLIGGYQDLVKTLKGAHGIISGNKILKTKKTVFNADNVGHETGEYPLFLGDQLGFLDTINTPYPVLDELYQAQLSQIWNEFEIDLTQDRQDMINARPEVVDLMVKTILWQHLADSIASRSITGILMDYVSNSDLESWYNCVALFETIHARSYSLIIKQTFNNPNEALKNGYEDLQVIQRSDILRDAFDGLGNLPFDAPREEKEEKLYIAIAALYMLESLNFMASFAITFGIVETGIMQGIGQIVSLICRDELLHARGGREVLNIEFKRNPELAKRLRPHFQKMFDAIVSTELEWTDYLFSQGRQVIGLNPELIKKYVLFMAQPVANTLGLVTEKIETTPLPYMETYIDSSKVQVAAQELQLTSYLVNSVSPLTDQDEFLAELRGEMY